MSLSLSPQEIAARVGLDVEELERQCEEGLLPFLADYVHPWRLVFCYLLAPIDLDDVDEECHSEQEKRLRCLRKWKARNGAGAKVGTLVETLLRNGNVDSAEAMCRRLLPGAIVQRVEALRIKDSSVVQSLPSSSCPQSPMKTTQSVDMIRSNEDKIKALFSGLLLEVQTALQSRYDVDIVRQFLANFFKCDLPETADLSKLFTAVTLADLWNHQHHSPVEQLLDHFLPDNQVVEKLMKAYKARLSGFYLTTKLIDYIEYQNLSASDDESDEEECDQPSPKLTTKQYRRIKVVLKLDRKLSKLSLDYVVKLWSSFADEYEIPSLTAVIERIVTGSLEVTWRVPQQVADAILPRSKFFRSHGIVLVCVDDVIIYDEKQMLDKEQIFLALCGDGTADIGQFSTLLKQGVDPDIFDKDGLHPLWFASDGNRSDLVNLLLEFHANVNLVTTESIGETALVAAVTRGHTQIVDILVKNRANVNYIDKKGKSVLWRACYFGRTDSVQLLLLHHAQVDLPNAEEREQTALFGASQEGHYDCAVLLMRHGATVNYLDKIKKTALYYAARNNHVRLAEFLLASGADVNEGQQSPLYVACIKGNVEIVQLLVRHHAIIDKPCDDEEFGATPLIMACSENHVDVASFLVDNGANVNLQNKYGWSSLQGACDRGNLDIVKVLMEYHADIELKNKEGRTAFMIASWRGRLSVVKEMIHAKATIDTQDQEGLTALMLATQNEHAEVVEALLNANADPNIIENSFSQQTVGWTALHFSANSGNLDITKQLLLKGANTDIKDKSGLTAAEVCENEEVRDELRQYSSSKSETDTQQTHHDTTNITDDQRKLVKKSYQKLLRIFDLLEDSLLPGRKEKRLYQQRKGMSSNITETNQKQLQNVY